MIALARIREPLSHVTPLRPVVAPTMPDDLYVVVILGLGRWPLLAADSDPCTLDEAHEIARDLIADGMGPVVVCRLQATEVLP